MTDDRSWQECMEQADDAWSNNDFALAESKLLKAKEVSAAFSDKDSRRARTLEKLAQVAGRQGKPESAESYYKEVVEHYQKCFGPLHARVANAMGDLAAFYYDQARLDDAEPLCKKVIGIFEKLYGRKHPEVANSLFRYALVLHEQKKYEKAETNYRKALAMRNDPSAPFDSDVIATLENLSNLLEETGRIDEAEHLRAIAMGRVSGKMRFLVD